MMITWRMEVKDETFTNLRDHPSVGQDYITPDDGVATLDDFSVDGAGNCLEATFRASPKFVDIRPRDIVSLEVSEDGGSTWTPVYRGYVVTAGNPRSQDIQSYKLVGLRQRFFEITNKMTHTTGTSSGFFDSISAKDIKVHADEVFAEIDAENDWPAGVINSVPTVPTFNFLLGVRYPQKESYGDTLKAIAEAAGRFVVNIGDTYTYDGVTYNEGDTVPAARFGVDASGNAFFRRPQGSTVTYAEGDDGLVANYVQVTGEEIFDVIELEYLSELSGFESTPKYFYLENAFDIRLSAKDSVQIPMRRSFTFGSNDARRVVRVQSPETFMDSELDVDTTFGTVVNPSNAYSGGTTELQSGSVGYKHVEADNLSQPEETGFLCKVRVYGSSTTNNLTFRFGIDTPPIVDAPPYLAYVEENFGSSDETFIFSVLPSSSVNDLPGFFKPDIYYDTIKPKLLITGTDVFIEELEILIPDVDVGGTKSEQFASGFVRDVQQDVAEVKVVGELGTVADRMNWTPTNESEVTVPVERIQYTLTPNDGLITTYELGQAFDAELLSERAVLKGLAREAVSE